MAKLEDPDETLSFLEEIEHAFRRMIVGVFRFTFIRLPTLVYEFFRDFFKLLERIFRYSFKLAVRLVRVSFFAGIWVLLVFGPPATTWYSGIESIVPHVIALSWAAIGLIGSVWGLNRIRRKHRLQQAAVKANEIAGLDLEAEPLPVEFAKEGADKLERPWVTIVAVLTPVVLLLLMYWYYESFSKRREDADDEPRPVPAAWIKAPSQVTAKDVEKSPPKSDSKGLTKSPVEPGLGLKGVKALDLYLKYSKNQSRYEYVPKK
jgi:hypothetical protein